VTFLIDGYNLMHAVGMLRKGVPEGELARSRTRFLNWLADASKERNALLRVVFDAINSPRASAESEHRGVRVLFAFHRTADDLIEELLAAEGMPSQVTVVSNDTRIQMAGHRRGSAVDTCEQFVDWLIEEKDTHLSPTPVPQPDKPEPTASADEMAAWLSAFSTPKQKKPKS
jgi:predicted RNA-binding protein with PIN domain